MFWLNLRNVMRNSLVFIYLLIDAMNPKYKSAENYMVDVLKHLDKKDCGMATFEQVSLGLQEMGVPLTHHEIYTLVRAFDKKDNFTLCVES